MERFYDRVLRTHFAAETQMAFLAGPRQVGKTTCARTALPEARYLNWDNLDHRALLLRGPEAVFNEAGGQLLTSKKKSVIFDEIHKYPRWKTFLKGFYDQFGSRMRVCVTGSARLNIYKHGGDSLMGRYFLYRMHPLSVRETAATALPKTPGEFRELHPKASDVAALLLFGGYPSPYLRREKAFYNRWKRQRLDLVFNEDVRDVSNIADLGRMRLLAQRLIERVGGQINYSHLATDLQVSVDTVRRWLDVFENLYFCFRVRPYSKNVARSILKEPKIFLWDWALAENTGARYENFLASHLLKAAHAYSDLGLGEFELFYVRDKNKREVDFLMTRDAKPWMLVEAKTQRTVLSESLHHFKKTLAVPHAFQAVSDLPHDAVDCFRVKKPVVVPATSLLSHLM